MIPSATRRPTKCPFETVSKNMRLKKDQGQTLVNLDFRDKPEWSESRKQDYTSGAIITCAEELETPQEAAWQFESKSYNTWFLHCFSIDPEIAWKGISMEKSKA